jgi:hypothetical protein
MGKPLDRRPRDPNQLGKLMVDIMSGEVKDTISPSKKDPQATRGRAGGIKGGQSRAVKLTSEQRKEIATRAAEARWKKSN